MQGCKWDCVQLSLSPFHFDPVLSQLLSLTVAALRPLLWQPSTFPFSQIRQIFRFSLQKALTDSLSPAKLSSFRQLWLASSLILSASDAHFHHSLNVSTVHGLLVSMQFCMLVAVAARDIGNSWAAGTHSLLAMLTPLIYSVWFYLPLPCQSTSISGLFVLW